MVRSDVSWVETYRSLLAGLGRAAASPLLRGRLDLSGVVQQTLLEAHLATNPPPSADVDGRREWVKRLFLNNLRDEARKLRAARRDVARVAADGYATLCALPAELSTPSQGAARAEDLLQLTAALATLPSDQRDAVELKYLGGLTVDEVAAQLGKTRAGAAGLLRRGLETLRGLLAIDPTTGPKELA